jgi:hypothetical protein
MVEVKEGSNAKKDGLIASRGQIDGGIGAPKTALKIIRQWNE